MWPCSVFRSWMVKRSSSPQSCCSKSAFFRLSRSITAAACVRGRQNSSQEDILASRCCWDYSDIAADGSCRRINAFNAGCNYKCENRFVHGAANLCRRQQRVKLEVSLWRRFSRTRLSEVALSTQMYVWTHIKLRVIYIQCVCVCVPVSVSKVHVCVCVYLSIHLLLCSGRWLSPEDGDSSCSVNEQTHACVCARARASAHVCVFVRESLNASGKDGAWASSQHTSCGCHTPTIHSLTGQSADCRSVSVAFMAVEDEEGEEEEGQVVICLLPADAVVWEKQRALTNPPVRDGAQVKSDSRSSFHVLILGCRITIWNVFKKG